MSFDLLHKVVEEGKVFSPPTYCVTDAYYIICSQPYFMPLNAIKLHFMMLQAYTGVVLKYL